MYTIYAIKSLYKNYIYVGLTSDLENRIHRHNSGYEKTTKPYRPYIVIYTEIAENRESARLREQFLISSTGKRFLRKLIENTNQTNQE